MSDPGVDASAAKAESFKLQGNDALTRSLFVEAISLYSIAIEANPSDGVLYSNRWVFEGRGNGQSSL